MEAFFYYAYNVLRNIFGSVYDVIVAIIDCVISLIDIKYYMQLFSTYYPELSPLGWIAAVFMHILLLLLFILVLYLLYRGLKVLLRFKVPVVKYEKMKDEVVRLQREIMKANYEKDKILAMKIAEMGMVVKPELLESELKEISDESEIIANNASVEELNAATEKVEEVKVEEVVTGELRFPRLSSVDKLYLASDYQTPVYNTNITLEELCVQFRNFAASRLGLYYELEIMRQVFATFGATKMLILQGISGTGKTSLPYAFGQFIQNPSLICSVQPSWRDRTELIGYYNDFTKKYTETDFLKTMYEAHYYDDMKVVILDEMNIARVEYYFAEMLSLLEMPRDEERFFSVVSSSADNDPKKMKDGKVWIPGNVWYVGTINNDDSTFAVSDKVYDRAIPIDLDDKADPFEAPDTPPMRISYTHIAGLYDEAKEKYPISDEMILELEKLDRYLIDHFRITFGNRILRQIKSFVPCYVACGGTEIDGVDFMFAKKILRKFESLGIGFIRDELDGLLLYLDTAFGKDNFKISKAYVNRLKRMAGAAAGKN